MRQIRTSGSMSGDGKRGDARVATAPTLDSTEKKGRWYVVGGSWGNKNRGQGLGARGTKAGPPPAGPSITRSICPGAQESPANLGIEFFFKRTKRESY
jgi:hypothetical protein